MNLSLRVKILALIAGSLSLSLLLYLYLGTTLLRDDKISYIYDYNLARVSSAASAIEIQFQQAVTVSKVIAASVNPQSGEASRAVFEKTFRDHALPLGLTGLVALRPIGAAQFRTELEAGDAAPDLKRRIAELGWTPEAYDHSDALVGPISDGRAIVGAKTTDASGAPLMVIGMLSLKPAPLDTGGTDFHLHLIDAAGAQLLAKPGFEAAVPSAEARHFEQELVQTPFQSGSRVEKLGARDFIVGYERIGFGRLVMVGYIPVEAAFSAIRTLAAKSLFTCLGVLLLAVGLTTLFIRKLTARLREMWHATQKVAAGDFSVRVRSTGDSGRDEISGLSNSFNVMAGKINDLMVQTAQKARMEKELETARIVQRRFFPSSEFVHPNLRIAGSYVPASECAGDWWHYAKIGNEVVAVIGDVTGHGVSAALVTAAAHGVFQGMVSRLQARPTEALSLSSIVDELNGAVLAAGLDNATMSMLALSLNLETGTLKAINASHPLAFLYRATSPKPSLSYFSPLRTEVVPLLGSQKQTRTAPSAIQLMPGDRLFLYTDGMLEKRADGVRVRKKEFLHAIAEATHRNGNDAAKICAEVITRFSAFLGTQGQGLPDDITFVTFSIPKDASFGRLPEAATASIILPKVA